MEMDQRDQELTDKQRFLRRKKVLDEYDYFHREMRYYREHEDEMLRPGFTIWTWGQEEAANVIYEV